VKQIDLLDPSASAACAAASAVPLEKVGSLSAERDARQLW